jgi:hypothetical protein
MRFPFLCPVDALGGDRHCLTIYRKRIRGTFLTTFFSWKLAAGYWALEKMVVDSSARESQAVHFCSMSGSGGWP